MEKIRFIICPLFFLFIGISCNPNLGDQQEAEKPLLFVPEDLEVTLWAESPLFFNPTNIDVDIKGRIWVAEAVNYRDFNNNDGHLAHPEGDRVMILEDSNGNGKADAAKVFVQDEDLRSPLGIAVLGNKIIVSCAPHIIVYTDENGDDLPDHKEIFLTGFGGKDHDHSVHSGVAGPDGKLYFNTGNAGPHVVTDQAGWTLRAGSVYTGGGPYNPENTPGMISDDGKIWTGGLAFRVNPDGTGLEVLAHNFRNSYEVFVDSFGNLWQNDNDDEVATCRTSWVMEGSNAGYFSKTGERTWRADRRPGQSIETAHWHQEDPGVMPSGDVYGSGSPTGVVLIESDDLGKQYRGLLLSADAGRNIIFGYRPKMMGAGYSLEERTNFIASVDTDNPNYRWDEWNEDQSKWFRPSDVAIGTDGALFVADWFDPIVGGHQMHDKEGYGRIYRISPKGKKLNLPQIDLESVDGQIQALLNPAINVRNQGFELLKAQGEKAVPQIKEILASKNPYHRARAVWLLSQLGENGLRETEALLADSDPNIQITALRALRQANPNGIMEYAQLLVHEQSAAVRREVILALKEFPLEESKSLLLNLIEAYDGEDRWYLNALGISLEGKQDEFYPYLLEHQNAGDPEQWSAAFANLVWELHPAASVEALQKRAGSNNLSAAERSKALVALAFIPTNDAAEAVKQLAEGSGEVSDQALYWLQFRKTNDWQAFLKDWKSPQTRKPEGTSEMLAQREHVANVDHSISERLAAAQELAKTRPGQLHLLHLAANNQIPDSIFNQIKNLMVAVEDRNLQPLINNIFKETESTSYDTKSISNLSVNLEKGKTLLYSNCIVCHKVGEAGGEFGPILSNIHLKYDKIGILEAVLHPDSGIAFGSEPYLVSLKDGGIVYGLLLSDGPVVTVMDVYNQRFMIEAADILSKKRLNFSPMPSPESMQLSEQDVADITAFLIQGKKE